MTETGRADRWGGRHREAIVAVTAFLLLFCGCGVPIAGELDDAQADRAVIALSQAGIAADKEADPAREGRYRISVSRGDAALAIAALHEENLPSPPPPGLVDAFAKDTIVPSELAEHAQYVAGLSGELERTLGAIDGVLAARVHLSIPPARPLGDAPPVHPSASVLIKHRGSAPPIRREQVQALVAGAAAGLAPADVAVVMLPRPALPASPGAGLVRLGPLAMTKSSLGWAKVILSAFFVLDIGLVATILAFWVRLRRLHHVAAAATAEVERPPSQRRAA